MLFFKLVMISLRSQMQYKASFVMLSIGHFISTFVDILAVGVLFDRFKMVKGWSLYEVAIIYGVVHMGFAIAESFARGFDTFSQMIKSGDFDRVLLRPMNPFFQIAVKEVQILRIGRFLQGFIVLFWGAYHLSLSFFSFHALVILLSVIGTGSLFYGLMVIQATISFWTIETLEIMNITTYGGVQTAQYPMSIYNKVFRLIFTFLIPLSCVAFYPVSIILGKSSFFSFFAFLFPLSGMVFLYLAFRFWCYGVKCYQSTGN